MSITCIKVKENTDAQREPEERSKAYLQYILFRCTDDVRGVTEGFIKDEVSHTYALTWKNLQALICYVV